MLKAKSIFFILLLFGNEILNCHAQIASTVRFQEHNVSKSRGLADERSATQKSSQDSQSTPKSYLAQMKEDVDAFLRKHARQQWPGDDGYPARKLFDEAPRDIEGGRPQEAVQAPRDIEARFDGGRPQEAVQSKSDPKIVSARSLSSKTSQKLPGEKGQELSKKVKQLKESVNKSEGKLSFGAELGAVYKVGLPLGFSSAARILQGVSNSVVLGRSDTTLLAAVAVSFIWTQITDNMVFTGIAQLSTLCSQAYGAGNKKLVGTYLQIGLVFITLAGIPILGLRWLTSPILKLVGLNHGLADLAGKYTIWAQATFLFDMWYYAVQRYYAAQQIVMPDAVVDAIFIFVNVGLVYLFVYVLHLGEDGVIGAAVGTSINRLLRLIVYVSYCAGKGYHRDTWFGWSSKEIWNKQRWQTLLKMVLPAAGGGLAEQLQFQYCSLLAAQFGPSSAAAFNLALNLLILCFVNAIALGSATGIRQSRLLGAGKALAARFTSRVGLAACMVGNCVFAIVIAAMMGPFVQIASHDFDVQLALVKLRWTSAVAIFLLGGFISLATILTTQGRPYLAAIIAPVMCWGVGFPVSYFSSRTRQLLGIFDGLNCGYGLAFVSLLIAYLSSNWPKLADQAQKRAEKRKSMEVAANSTQVNVGTFSENRRTSSSQSSLRRSSLDVHPPSSPEPFDIPPPPKPALSSSYSRGSLR